MKRYEYPNGTVVFTEGIEVQVNKSEGTLTDEAVMAAKDAEEFFKNPKLYNLAKRRRPDRKHEFTLVRKPPKDNKPKDSPVPPLTGKK